MEQPKHPHIEALRAYTEDMPKHCPFYLDSELTMHLETIYGGAEAIGVYSDDNASVCRVEFQENTQTLEHSHQQREVLMVLEGELVIVFNDGLRSIRIKQHGVLEIPPDEVHYSRNIMATVVLATLMPYSPHFPKPNEQ